jgi:glycosyltransferase involved in cell wall biosynthesis
MTAHVRFLGPQPYDRMITMMHAADIYLCLGKSDMLASSLLEALCTELVPVLHNLPAYQEVVKDRVNGMLLNKLDQQSITNALTDVLHNYQELRKQYGEKNRLLIKQNYDSRQNTAWLVNQLAAIAAIPAHELNLPLSRSLS